jgi:5-methylthioadenosine/S-adenosylhomocysteine deaminase
MEDMDEADIVIHNGTVLTMDPENRVYERGRVCIRGDTLSYVGPEDADPVHGTKTLDARGGLILPGLVNAHTHAAMTLFRGLADDLPLMDWLNGYIFPVESRMDGDFVYTGTLLACAEMILSGTTTFCDMYLFEDRVAQAAREAGMRCLAGEVLYDFPSPHYGPPEKGLAFTERLIEAWADDPLVSIAVEPHSLFTCSPDLLRASGDLAEKYAVPLVIHLAETQTEIAEVREKHGSHPVEFLDSLNLLSPRLLADHCVHLDASHIRTLADHDVKIAHNPESNMKLASGVAPVPHMLAQGLTVGLGTDGCASNNNLDLFAEMDTAAKLHKLQSMDPTAIDALTVLRMATIEGAAALGFGLLTGSLEKGKKADVIIVDTDKPHLTPLYNPYSHLVYAARGNDVSHTIINGQVVMEDRQLLTLDLEAVMSRAEEKATQVRRWVYG